VHHRIHLGDQAVHHLGVTDVAVDEPVARIASTSAREARLPA